MTERLLVRVGQAEGDLVGHDNRVLQAAVDYVGLLEGGTVAVGPGVYTMYDSLRLKPGVTLRGSGPSTVLRMAAGTASPLVTDGDYGDREVEVADAAGFPPGRGISVGYLPRPDGWHTTVATVLRREGSRLLLSRPLAYDHLYARGAAAQTSFPLVAAYEADGVTIADLTVDGNRQENGYLGGCVGGGIYLYRSHRAEIRHVMVRGYNGDGISWQLSDEVRVLQSRSIGNASKGLHPGSGSQRPLIRGCEALENGEIGLFLCWRVREGLIEENDFSANGVTGISIGHKDTDNLFRQNRVCRNGTHGILLREETEPLAGHRNRFEGNEIAENGRWGVYVGGETHDLFFRGNRLAGNPEPLFIGPGARGVRVEE
jgi:hypothetical protein